MTTHNNIVKSETVKCDHKFINSNYCLKCGWAPAHENHHYAFVLTKHGWRNQGMVPDNNRQPFIEDYLKTRGTRVAFVPFCWHQNPNVMTDSEINDYANAQFGENGLLNHRPVLLRISDQDVK